MLTLFSELSWFVKKLFSEMDTTTDELTPKAMSYFPATGYKYTMWCGYVVYRETKPENGTLSDVDKNHEKGHVHQAHDKGSWLSYYWSYVIEWLKMNPLFYGKEAYYLNKYEVEAYAKEEDLTYLERRGENWVDKFEIENPHAYYKSVGNTSYSFKKAIKELYKDI